MPKLRRLILIALGCQILLTADFAIADAPDNPPAVEASRKARWMEDIMFGRATIGGPFTLTDTEGRRRSLQEFRGRIVLLYYVLPRRLSDRSHRNRRAREFARAAR